MLAGDARTDDWIALIKAESQLGAAIKAVKAIEPLLTVAFAALESDRLLNAATRKHLPPTPDTGEAMTTISAHQIALAAIEQADHTHPVFK